MTIAEPSVARSRRLLSAARHAPDRLLHASRRRALARRIRGGSVPTRITFICHGNICRSPYAAASLQRRLEGSTIGGRILIRSAGFVGPGRPPPPEAIQVARAGGLDLSEHRSRLLTVALAMDGALLVVMAPGQRRAVSSTFGTPRSRLVLLGDLDPEPIRTRAIRDPYRQSADVFKEVYARIDRCLDTFVRHLLAAAQRDGGTPVGPRVEGLKPPSRLR